MKTLNGKWGAPKSENEMGEGVKLMVGPCLIDLERPGDMQANVNDLIQIRKLYDLAFTITMKSSLTDLGVFARGNGRVFVTDNQAVQNNLRGDAEGKDQ